MRFLVTGASGMLGANLCRRLVRSGHDVRALVRSRLQHPLLDGLEIEGCLGDITQPETLRPAMQGCDGVFHVAGFISYLPRDWRLCRAVNVAGTEHVLDAAAEAGVRRVVITSSTASVGIPLGDQSPLNETDRFAARFRHNPYMATKHEAEQRALARQDLEVVAANPSTIYGAGDVKMNTGALFRRIAAGRMKWAPPGGTAVVGVDDVAAGHWDAWEKGRPGERYILSTVNLSLQQLTTMIAESLGVEPPQGVIAPIWFKPLYAAAWLNDQTLGRLGLGALSRHVVEIGFRNRYFDSQKARSELSWNPRQSVDQMIAEATAFYRQHDLLT